jgi:hypothetical protein
MNPDGKAGQRTDGGTIRLKKNGNLLCTPKHFRRYLWKIYDGPGTRMQKQAAAAQFIAAKDPDGVAEMVVPVQEGGQGMTYLFKVRGFLSFLQISTCMAH